MYIIYALISPNPERKENKDAQYASVCHAYVYNFEKPLKTEWVSSRCVCVWNLGETLGAWEERDPLDLGFLLATTDATETPLDRAADTAASGVAAADARGFSVGSDGRHDAGCFGMANAASARAAGGHLCAAVAEALVVLQGLLNGVGRFALALEIVWVVFNTRPTTVVSSRLSHQVSTLFIIEYSSETISHARWYDGDSLQGTMPLYRVDNVLPWSSSQSLLVRVLNRCEGTVFLDAVASETGSIVWALVVVPTERCLVETIDDVGALEVLFPKMGSTVSNFLIMTQLVKRPV